MDIKTRMYKNTPISIENEWDLNRKRNFIILL